MELLSGSKGRLRLGFEFGLMLQGVKVRSAGKIFAVDGRRAGVQGYVSLEQMCRLARPFIHATYNRHFRHSFWRLTVGQFPILLLNA